MRQELGRVAARAAAGGGRPDRLRLLAEGALAVLILAQATRLALVLLSPQAEASTPAPAAGPRPDLSVFARSDAFFQPGSPAAPGAETAPTEGLRLFGVRAGQGGGGSAILGLADGRQLSVGVGEEIAPGLILRTVALDHVTVARGPTVSRIEFGEIGGGAMPVAPPAPTTPQVVAPPKTEPTAEARAAAPVVDPQRLIGQASLRPRMKGMSVSGFTVSAAGDGQALRSAGLRNGDVILAVNGVELNGMGALAGLRAELADATTVDIRYERAGRVSTTTIRTGR
ncbi:MAG: PDZ domain-containing protein [Alphaproteobacteria bacterium]|nr:PDZ domain-containing protein [Alphaproteobacteria bacterium]MBU1525949.1 PDZ domain-containing protein [Alphaproteobacteria bacterium]MBU2351602.1 PDZ domain-containing protein [Alphaproteobacteria bacterium]MBU2383814.1 PDZ domain-containing protein [Alphaproteobacteria bacterium]